MTPNNQTNMQPMNESIQDSMLVEELHRLQIFNHLSAEEILSIVEHLDHEQYEMGKVLYQIGEPYEKSLFILYKGKVGLWGADGEKQEKEPGTILGLSNYVDGLPFSCTAIALSPISLLVVRNADHKELEQFCPALHQTLNQLIAKRIRGQQVTRQSYIGALTQPAKSFMKSPLATCDPDISLAEAFHILKERMIGSLLITDNEERLVGVLTFAGLAEAMVNGAKPSDNVMNAACQRAYTVSSDTPLWEVEEAQNRHTLKYVVVSENNHPLGMISQSDILRALLREQGGAREELRSIKSFSKLEDFRNRIIAITLEAREHNHRASAAVRILSEFHLAIQRRCVELTLHKLKSAGHGKPPENFVLLIMGSGGRKEMLLNPDQDNALIIDASPDALSDASREWFSMFAEKLVHHLEKLGYRLSKDDIMATNPMFCKTLDEWRNEFSALCAKPTNAAMEWVGLFLDFETLYGDESLTERLHQHVSVEIKRKPALLNKMVKANAKWTPPLGFFNQIIPKGYFKDVAKGKIDLKNNGLRILVEVIRIYALKSGIRNKNTVDRLNGLVRQGELGAEDGKAIRVAFEALTDLLLVHQLHQAEKNKPLDKLIKPKQLSEIDQETLRMAMRVIKDLQEMLQDDFKKIQ